MKRRYWISTLVTPVLLITLNAWAHDPSEHMKSNEKADCGAMQDMDHSKMDMNDPVMMAMMQKCMHQDEDGHHGAKDDAEHRGGHMSTDESADEHHHMH